MLLKIIMINYDLIAGKPRNCEEASADVPSPQSDSIEIDPDGLGGVNPFNVTCTVHGKCQISFVLNLDVRKLAVPHN